jgi:hypothetical protein
LKFENSAYSRNEKDRSEFCLFHKFKRSKLTLFIPLIGKIEAKLTLFIQELKKIEAKRTQLITEIDKIEAKKTNWIEVKQSEAVFLKLLWSAGIYSKKLIPQAYALVGWSPYL